MTESTPERVRAGGRGEDFYRSFLVGYGALFFAPHPVSGALFLLGTFASGPLLGTAVLVGLFAATSTAHFLRRSRLELEQGLYGFNGALAAFAVFSLEGEASSQLPLVALAAALSVPLSAWLMDGPWGQRLGFPVLSLPSLIVGFPLAVWLVHSLGRNALPATTLPAHLVGSSVFDPGLYGPSMRTAVGGLGAQWPLIGFFLCGVAVHSRRLLAHVVVGVLLGGGVGFAFLGWVGAFDFSFVIVTALPTYLALGAVFTGGGWRSAAYGAAGVVLSFAAWFALGLFLTDRDLPLLTAPFLLSTVVGLGLLRALPAGGVTGLPSLLPLHQVASPASAERWATEREFGWRYWQELAGDLAADAGAPSDSRRMERARKLVARSRRTVVLTGAGISTESGIPDYRTGAVAWKQYDTDHFRFGRFMASEESRKAYWRMSQDFFLVLRAAQPNAAHDAIASLDRRGTLEAVVTQNVDRLHQRAGVAFERVVEIHGNEHGVTCLQCGRQYDREEIYRWIQNGVEAPYCSSCQGILKPDSVAFDQPMIESESARALTAVARCDLLIVAGTSLEVQPVASLPLVALRAGKPLIVVNLQATDYDCFAEVVLRGSCGSILPEICREAAGR
ncbi:MAG: urea transporter [Planctomycetota bacterium]|nr:urea transporter [Planctomycetota bacterium]MDP6989433.1 urea transporter [Planctomycetota bacterium]